MILHSKPWITREDLDAVQAALAPGQIGQGERAREFERRLCAWTGAAGGVSTASGTGALLLGLQFLRCGPGSEVILPTYVCRQLLQAVQSLGATPVLCDAGPDWVVEAAEVSRLVTARTRALVLPHLYGIYVDVGAFRSLGVPIIEDLAQGLGGEGKRPIRGDLAVLSFHPTKCLTTGEGGMLVVRDPKALGRLEEVTDVSRAGARIAVFSPLSDMAASLGQSQVARYDRGLRRRSEIASSYAGALEGSEANFDWYGRRECMFFRFPLRFAGGLGAVQEKFASAGVTVRRGVDELLHRLLGRPDSDFPRATQHYHETVSLPIYPALEDAELESCIAAARGALFSRRVTA